jgi:DNA-binding IclR family transcriptional regulator
VIPDDIGDFARSLRSLWAIELLLLLYRAPDRTWRPADLVRELRSSPRLVEEVLALLVDIGIVQRDSGDAYRYGATSTRLGELVGALDRMHRERPLSLAREIHSMPNEKLRAFSDAFRLKKD